MHLAAITLSRGNRCFIDGSQRPLAIKTGILEGEKIIPRVIDRRRTPEWMIHIAMSSMIGKSST